MKKLLMVLLLLALTFPLTAGDFRHELWSVGDSAAFQNERMEVVFVYPTNFPSLALDYVTLAEGMENGTVEVTEIKPGLIRGRDRPNQYEVVLLNNSGKHLILLAGEILAGGKQDRVISEDRIVPPTSDPVPISVLCAQRNRWKGETVTFKYSGVMASPSVRGSVGTGSQNTTWAAIAQAGGIASTGTLTDMVVSDTAEFITAPSGELLMGTSTGTIAWEFVDTGSAYIAVEAVKSKGELAIEKELKEARPNNAIGAVLVLDGKAVSSDVFATPLLFSRYWSKLVRSYVIEARRAGVKQTKKTDPVYVASGFLVYSTADYEVQVKPSVYSVSRLKREGTTATVLRSLAEAGSPLLHYSKLRK